MLTCNTSRPAPVPAARQVALKLIRSGIYDGAVARRFKSEQQSLAIMEHPVIAKVLDARFDSERPAVLRDGICARTTYYAVLRREKIENPGTP